MGPNHLMRSPWVLSGLMWGLLAGVLPYPLLIFVISGARFSALASGVQQVWHWIVAMGLAAGIVAALLSWPYRRGWRWHWSLGLVWWILTGVVSFAIGLTAGGLTNSVVIALRHQQPLALGPVDFGSAGGFILGIGSIPMIMLGLISFPVFWLTASRVSAPAVPRERGERRRWLGWLVVGIAVVLVVVAVLPRFGDNGLSRWVDDERRVAEQGLSAVNAALLPGEREILVQNLVVDGVKRVPGTASDADATTRYDVGVRADGFFGVTYARFNVVAVVDNESVRIERVSWGRHWWSYGGVVTLILCLAALAGIGRRAFRR